MKRQFQSGKRASALIVLIIAVTILQLSYLASFKLTSMVKKRSDEVELKFRLKAYKKAIEKYHKLFRRYPSKLEDLITISPNPRILRELYKEPISENGKWKIVHLNDGILIKNVQSASKELAIDGTKYSLWSYTKNLEFTIFSEVRLPLKRNN